MHVVVIGGGAAGFFAAISAARHHPGARVTLLEKGAKLLSKVRISGGGRCNVTHDRRDPKGLAANYPHGEAFLRKSFKSFSVADTLAWFDNEGVALVAEPDGRMFPVSNDSATIVDCLLGAASRAGVVVRCGAQVTACSAAHDGFRIALADGGSITADRVIVTTGGHPKAAGYDWIAAMGHGLVPPVPSLFTFNMPNEPIRGLMGVVAPQVRARIVGADLESHGPLLITHWGMSGPAVLRLSAWGARLVHAAGYRFTLQVNWLGGKGEEYVRSTFGASNKLSANVDPFGLPKRLWGHLLEKAGIAPLVPWSTVGRKERNRLVDLLVNDRYQVEGKTTFKEEFVTAGGVDLAEVDPLTMASTKIPGLYFAGEVLDIDGITGGFNFQAAWTTGHLAGMLR